MHAAATTTRTTAGAGAGCEGGAAVKLGWAQVQITPPQPVLIAGQFHARRAEGVDNPLTATVLVLATAGDQVVLVSCDLSYIPDALRDGVRTRVQAILEDQSGAGSSDAAAALDPMKIILNATHTHTGPELRTAASGSGLGSRGIGIEMDVTPIDACVDFIAARVADAVVQAWRSRSSGGGIAFGLGQAVVSRNRRWVNDQGESMMYNLADNAEFRHIEGFEDHSLNLLATYDAQDHLTGLVVNLAAPSQVAEGLFTLSADYWHETRQELRRRFGQDLFILPQCSAAGDQAPRPLFEKAAHDRMLELKGRTAREEIAQRIADGVADVLPAIQATIDRSPTLGHHVQTLALPLNRLTQADADTARQEAARWRAQYEQEKARLDADPALRDQPRWYTAVTKAWRRMGWHLDVVERFDRQSAGQATIPAELHVLRLGEIAMSTCPFEYYLDFGIQIKVRSPAIQTFLVQLTGNGTYLPSPRSVAGGGYGSVPASNVVGPQAGQQLAERSLEIMNQFWAGAAEEDEAASLATVV